MKIIDNNFKITSILVRGFYTSYLTASLIEQFKDKNVLLLQDWKCYHSCKRFELVFGLDLNLLIEDLKNEFDVLIIEKFKDSVNFFETINFIKNISVNENLKNKQFIILFSANRNDEELVLEDFKNLKDTILTYSDNIYSFNIVKGSIINKYKIKNLKTKQESFYRENRSDFTIKLREIDE